MSIDYVPSPLTQEDFDQAGLNQYTPVLDLPIPYDALKRYVKALDDQMLSGGEFESHEDYRAWLESLLKDNPDVDVFTQGNHHLGEAPLYIEHDKDCKGFYLLDEKLEDTLNEQTPYVMITPSEEGSIVHVGYLFHYFDKEVHDDEVKEPRHRVHKFLTDTGVVDVDLERSSFHYSPRFASLVKVLEAYVINRRMTNLYRAKPQAEGVLKDLGENIEIYDVFCVPHMYYTAPGMEGRSLKPFHAGRLFEGTKGTLYRPFTLDAPVMQLDTDETGYVPLVGDYIESELTGVTHQVSSVKLVKYQNEVYINVVNQLGADMASDDLQGVMRLPYQNLQNFMQHRNVTPGDLSKYESNTLTFFGLDDKIFKAIAYGDYEEYILPGINTKLSAFDALSAVKKGYATLAYIEPDAKTWRAIRLTDRNDLHQTVRETMFGSDK